MIPLFSAFVFFTPGDLSGQPSFRNSLPMNLISKTLNRRIPKAIWIGILPLLILANPAIGQLDNDFSPRSFHGAPLVASVQLDAKKPGGPSIFRNYRFDSQGTLRTIEQGSDTLGVTLEVTFESDSEGRPVKASAVFMGNLGWTESYSYDEKGRLEAWVKLNPRTGVETVSKRHIYDEAGRQVKTVFVQAGRPPEATTRTFDASNRVLQEDVNSEDKFVRRITLEYDASGCLAKQVTLLTKGRVEIREWKHRGNCQVDQLEIRTFGGKINLVEMTYDGKGNLTTETTVRTGSASPEVKRWTYEFEGTTPKPETPETSE